VESGGQPDSHVTVILATLGTEEETQGQPIYQKDSYKLWVALLVHHRRFLLFTNHVKHTSRKGLQNVNRANMQ
jgi:hypothetical protein